MPEEPLKIDGAMDEGGGQIVRMATALSACTGKPLEITRIRAKRPIPGLAAQHCTAVQAVARACGARVSGCEKGSASISFYPGPIRTAEIDLDIGSAGSIPLVIQAWLPVAMHTGGVLRVSGGTEVRMSPTIDYIKHVFLPVLRSAGAVVTVDVLSRGYYPRGGGRVQVTVAPVKLSPLSIEPVPPDGWGICSSSSNLPAHVAERQARQAEEILREGGVAGCSVHLDPRDGISTGSSCTAWHGARGGSALGERGVPAEEIGARAARDLLEAVAMPGEVDLHLSDQLLVYLALYGGKITTSGISSHARTMCGLLGQFGYDIRCTRTGVVTFSA